MTNPRAPSRVDGWIGLALFVAVLGYWASWPHNLGASDESHFYYHSVRVLDGEVPYRDFFEFYTPLAFYGMALLFGLFGVQIGTAKAAMAVVHALTAVAVYAGARRTRVRQAIAGVFALAFPALGPPAWHFGSPHWIAACLLVAVLAVVLGPPPGRPRLLAAGVLTGMLASMQQQTGLPIALGVAAAIALEHALDRRFGGGAASSLASKLSWYAVPAAVVTVGVLGIAAVAAGLEPIVEQIFIHPFTGYRAHVSSAWGSATPLSYEYLAYTAPWILTLAPPLLIATLIVRLTLAWRSRDRTRFGSVPTLLVYSIATTSGVLYYPDFIHLAFVVAVFLVAGAELAERALATLPDAVSHVAVAAAVVPIAWMLVANLERARDAYPFPGQTEFGRIDFDSTERLDVIELVRKELAGSPNRDLFCYPVYTSLYLTTGAHNPTRHAYMNPSYLGPEQYRQTIGILESRRVRTVVVNPRFMRWDTDPIAAYLSEHYRCVDDATDCRVFRRVEADSTGP